MTTRAARSPYSALTAGQPPLQRAASDNPTSGSLVSLAALAPGLSFLHGGAAETASRIDIDYLRAFYIADVPEFQTQPAECWTEARVRISGPAAVQATTTYRDTFAANVRLVVVGTSDWRTLRGEWITLRTGRV